MTINTHERSDSAAGKKPGPAIDAEVPFAKLVPNRRYKIVVETGEWYSFEFVQRLASPKIGFYRLVLRELFMPAPSAEWLGGETTMAVPVSTVFKDMWQ